MTRRPSLVDETLDPELRAALKRDAFSATPDLDTMSDRVQQSIIRPPRRRWVASLAAAVAAVLVVTAVGLAHRAADSDSGAGTSPSAAPPASAAATYGLTRAPWILYGQNGTDVDIGVMLGGRYCDRYSHVQVHESSTTVEIQAWIDRTPYACAEILRYVPVTVSLHEPMGGRALTGCLIEQAMPPHDNRSDCGQLVERN